MLKIRLQGTKESLEWFCKFINNRSEIEVLEVSEIFSNKGTNKYYRRYVEIQKMEDVEDN